MAEATVRSTGADGRWRNGRYCRQHSRSGDFPDSKCRSKHIEGGVGRSGRRVSRGHRSQRAGRNVLQRNRRYRGRADWYGDVPSGPRAKAITDLSDKDCLRELLMNCKETRDLLNAYVDGELDSAGSLAVETHMRGCTSCLGEVESLHRLASAIESGSLRFKAPGRL